MESFCLVSSSTSRCAAARRRSESALVSASSRRAIVIGDLISYQNDGKGRAAIAGDAEKA